jgi:hypothetical protein
MSLPKIPTSVKSISADLLARFPEYADRIGRAAQLVEAHRFSFAYHDHTGAPVYVMTSSDGVSRYTTEAGACSCPSRTLCYHRIARRIIVLRNHNLCEVEFGCALALEEESPTPPSPQTTSPNVTYHGPAYTPDSGVKRVQSAGRLAPGLSIRESMDALGRRLREVRVTLIAAKG